MKVVILCFSPSGNTERVAQLLSESLIRRNIQVDSINIARREDFIGIDLNQETLQKLIPPHDILCIGSPVYAHHLQYILLDLIAALPKPNEQWGSIAVPFVTYGGISSGIALDEAVRSLKKTGRKSIAAMKICASHRMTRAFMEKEFNGELVVDDQLPEIEKLADAIVQCNLKDERMSTLKKLRYNGLETTIKAKLIFKEKEWHQKRYPKIYIITDICNGCGSCAKECPVLHLQRVDKKLEVNPNSPCIHCFNCVKACKKGAIALQGDLEKGRAFMSSMIARKGNTELPANRVFVA